MMKYKYLAPLVFIVILALALRFAYLDRFPPALNWDEVSHGYNAFSILKTGRDEWGNFFPAIFKAFGDYKLPVYVYLTAISEAIFGLNALAVRLPSLLAGVSAVIFTYFLANKLFGRKVATISALLVAIEPWSLFLSRGAFEANLSFALIVSGVYFLLVGVQKYRYLPVSTALLGLSVWTYNSARIFVPLFLLTFLIIYRDSLRAIYRKKPAAIYWSLIVLAVFILPMFYQLLRPAGQARYGKVAIIDEGAIAKINEIRQNSKLAGPMARLVFNKATFFVFSFGKNWISHFTPRFLFFEGGTQYQFNVPQKGLLYLIDLPFILLGLIYLFKKQTKGAWLILGWLVVAPIPSSITREAPHVLRAITMLPVPMMLAALGLIVFLEKIPKKLRLVIPILYSIGIFALLVSYLQSYFLDYPRNYSWSWQYGYKEVVEYAKTNYFEYDKIIVTKKYGEPHEFFLFYWPWSPARYQNDPDAIKFYQSDWYWIDRFDKFYFVNDWQIPQVGEAFVLESKGKIDCVNSRCLLITSPGNYPLGWKSLETINFLDKSPAFEIYEN